jgi:hypothetical protein
MERIHLPLFVMLSAVMLIWGALGVAKVFARTPSQACPNLELPSAIELAPENWQIG